MLAGQPENIALEFVSMHLHNREALWEAAERCQGGRFLMTIASVHPETPGCLRHGHHGEVCVSCDCKLGVGKLDACFSFRGILIFIQAACDRGIEGLARGLDANRNC